MRINIIIKLANNFNNLTFHVIGNLNQVKYKKLSNLYLNDTLPSNTSSYGTFRQHNYSSMSSTTNNFNTLMDSSSFNKFMEYNLDSTKIDTKSILNQNIGIANRESTLPTNSNTLRLLDITDKKLSQNNSSLLKMIQ